MHKIHTAIEKDVAEVVTRLQESASPGSEEVDPSDVVKVPTRTAAPCTRTAAAPPPVVPIPLVRRAVSVRSEPSQRRGLCARPVAVVLVRRPGVRARGRRHQTQQRPTTPIRSSRWVLSRADARGLRLRRDVVGLLLQLGGWDPGPGEEYAAGTRSVAVGFNACESNDRCSNPCATVREIHQTLDKNAATDYKEFISECSVAIACVLLIDITDPPPSLFLQSPKRYSAAVNNASGKILLKILKYAGFPSEGHRYDAVF
jgi:hypothetical protein